MARSSPGFAGLIWPTAAGGLSGAGALRGSAEARAVGGARSFDSVDAGSTVPGCCPPLSASAAAAGDARSLSFVTPPGTFSAARGFVASNPCFIKSPDPLGTFDAPVGRGASMSPAPVHQLFRLAFDGFDPHLQSDGPALRSANSPAQGVRAGSTMMPWRAFPCALTSSTRSHPAPFISLTRASTCFSQIAVSPGQAPSPDERHRAPSARCTYQSHPARRARTGDRRDMPP